MQDQTKKSVRSGGRGDYSCFSLLSPQNLRKSFYCSLFGFAAFLLVFVFAPYMALEANAAINTADATVTWTAASLTFDPDYAATQAYIAEHSSATIEDAIAVAGHGDVSFGDVSPTANSGDNKGTMVVVKKRLRTITSGTYYTLFLSVGGDTTNNLVSDTDSAKIIPAINGGWGNPVAFTDAAWGYAVPATNISTVYEGATVTPTFEGAGGNSPADTFASDTNLDTQLNATTYAAYYNQNAWAAVPLYGSAQQIYSATNNSGFPSGDTVDVYYAVVADTDILAGTYSNTLMYTAIASTDAIDVASQNITRSLKYVGPGITETISFDMTSSTAGFLTANNTHIYVVPHADFVAGYDSTGETYTVTSAMTTAREDGDYDECAFTTSNINTSGTGVSITCTMPNEAILGNNDGEGMYDFWVHIDDYNFDYLSKYTSGNNLVAAAQYVGLQSKDANGYVVTKMQEMGPGICASTNIWNSGTGSYARILKPGSEPTISSASYSTDNQLVTDAADATTTLTNNAALGVGTFALEDTRDHKHYLVRHLADGNCWMVQNLDLELSTSGALSSATSDVSNNWDPYASTNTKINNTYATQLADGNLTADWKGLSTWLYGQDQSAAGQYQPEGTGNQGYYWGTKRTADDTLGESVVNNAYSQVPRSYSNTTSAGAVQLYRHNGLTGANVEGATNESFAPATWNSDTNNFEGSGYYGQYYNWYAATAETGTFAQSSGNASDSICPKGWQLPVNGGNGTSRSWQDLLYGHYTTDGSTAITSGSAGSLAMRQIPLSIPFTGYYGWTNGALNYRGSYGTFWSSTAGSTAYARYLNFYASNIYPQNSVDKVNGFSVRCVVAP